MSLIDPKHMLAPFKHTMHIVTIVFLVLLFTVFRLATGGIEIENPADELRAASRGQTVAPTEPKPHLPGTVREQPSPVGEAPRELQDIERALGLKQ